MTGVQTCALPIYYLHQEGPNLGKHCVPRLLLPLALDTQFGTPYSRSAGFDTNIGAFIESSFVSSIEGLMARFVINDNITSGGALVSGQTLRLGSFTMGSRSAVKPKAAQLVTENDFHVGPE